MFQNIKVDIIYYKTNTDFELEFNLCGCCRMRLLNNKASDRKNLVHHLARAVSRSRVIIISGSLFGDDGIINTVANSIGKPVSEINNMLYGITGDDLISIIKGSTPLVTPEGYFGGCIIESGPQSMIILTDNKTIRKSIMKTLIHPYIEELCAIDLQEKAASASSEYTTSSPTVSSSASVPIVPPIADISSAVPTPGLNINPASVTADIEAGLESMLPNTEGTHFAVDDVDSKSEDEPVHGDSVNSEEYNKIKSESDSINKLEETKPSKQGEAEIKLSKGMVFETVDPAITTAVTDIKDDIIGSVEPQTKKEDSQISLNDLLYEPNADVIPETDTASVKNEVVYKNDDSIFYGADDQEDKRPHSAINIPILVISILLLIVLAILCYCIFYVPAKSEVSASSYLHDIFSTLFG